MLYIRKRMTLLIMLATNTLLLIYILIFGIIGSEMQVSWTRGKIFNQNVNIAWILIIMTLLELTSTLTFQLRILLTAKYNNNKSSRLRIIIPLIAGFSWIVAGIQGIILIGDSDDLYKTIIKLFPVFIATFNGVYLSLGVNSEK